LLGAAGLVGTKIIGTVAPITWQNYIKNGKLTKDEKFALRSKNLEKSESWHKTNERNFRKERTIRFINMQFDKTITDNDVADACGIGFYAINNWNKTIGVDK